MGQGSIVNDFLSWSGWVPWSRLSFSAYLVHKTVISIWITTQEHGVYLSDTNLVSIIYLKPFLRTKNDLTQNIISKIYSFCGHLLMTYFTAYWVSMFFEVPILGLEKFIFPQQERITTQVFDTRNTEMKKADYTVELNSRVPFSEYDRSSIKSNSNQTQNNLDENDDYISANEKEDVRF